MPDIIEERVLDNELPVAREAEPVLERLEGQDDFLRISVPEDSPPLPGPAAPTGPEVIKRLVVFSDGTGNSSAKAEKTNVWRMFEALDRSTPHQLAFYDNGVGTSRNKYLATLGGAFGWGLKQNVIDIYKFVCRNYSDEAGTRTEIYGFGFSRGAFTIRVLTGLIATEGLVNYSTEAELDQLAHRAYNKFRNHCMRPAFLSPVHVYRSVRNLLAHATRPLRGTPRVLPTRRNVKIEFLGLWDTVSAYGMPIDELKPAINWLFWPMKFNDLKLSSSVGRACHALALDDERTTFHPIIWDEHRKEDSSRLSQVWFAGVHSNVGGGYPEDRLSLVSLDWMMEQVKSTGLKLQGEYVAQVRAEKDALAKIYDSRAGVGAFYRYSPRTTHATERKGGPLPVIHWSVIERMTAGADAYVPSTLPPKFLVQAPNGELIPMHGFPDADTQARIDAAAPLKTPQSLDQNPADIKTNELKSAIQRLSTPTVKTVEPVLNIVWLRRILWVATAILAALGAAFPLFARGLHADIRQSAAAAAGSAADPLLSLIGRTIVSWDKELRGPLAKPAELVNDLVPGLLEPWVDSIARYPVEFILIALAFVGSAMAGNILHVQLRDFARAAWHARADAALRHTLGESESLRMRRTIGLLALFDLLAGAACLLPDAATAALLSTAGFVNLLALARIAWHRRCQSVLKDPARPISSGYLTQWVVGVCRCSPALQAIGLGFRKMLLPFLFGVALVYGMVVAANRIVFDVASSAGVICESTRSTVNGGRLPTVKGLVTAGSSFRADQLCWSSGWRLEGQTRYRIIVDARNAAWFDRETPTDPTGFEADSLIHTIATPLKRAWNAPWFRPFAHVGRKGQEEYELTPCTSAKNGNRKLLVAELTTKHDGELFLFVNDAVVALPGLADYFYRNNRGTATVQIEPVRPGVASEYAAACSG